MADLFQLESGLAESSSPSGISPASSSLSTGDLRRKYDFGDRVSELAIAQDPFFRLVSKVSKKPTDDPEFKFTERRPSFHKRYAYATAFSADNVTWVEDLQNTNATEYDEHETAGSVVYVKLATDYKKSGNIQNVYGQSANEIVIGADGTQPGFFMPGQMIKLNWSAATGGSIGSYSVLQILEVSLQDESTSPPTDHTHGEAAVIKGKVVKVKTADDDYVAGPMGVAAPVGNSVHSQSIAGTSGSNGLEQSRVYVIGSAHSQGSGYPETWKDQPFSTGYGRTQIWKTSMAMDNTTRATVLKYEPNEWARTWREKLIEHKFDIETSLLFGAQYDSGDEWYTQGAVDYILNYGNVFSLNLASKTQDDFLDDLSNFLDPRYNNANASVFMVDTATYNWLHKLSGYFSNNLEISPNFRADMSLTAKKKVFGVDISVISTPYGDMNVARNIHLDGSEIKILACNMKYVKYRPLVGNGLNRDTSVYVGVQTLENSGVDRRVDLIQTEAGMEFQMPEAHAYWT
mgnify:CR=1 FL=1|tara:strand:+ start:3643 stop:5190 length:1548 start_codon:yes stop_codon:yes gene_type:complete